MKNVLIYLILSGISFSGFTKNLDVLVSKTALEVKSLDITPTPNFLISAVKSATKAATTATKLTLIAGSASSTVG